MIDLYEAAVAEVRNKATRAEQEALEADPTAWREALLRVIDEMDAQFVYREGIFQDNSKVLSDDDLLRALEDYNKWRLGASTFKKHISARLATVSRMAGQTISVEDFVACARAVLIADDDDEFDVKLNELADLLDKYDRLHPVS